LFVWRDSNLR